VILQQGALPGARRIGNSGRRADFNRSEVPFDNRHRPAADLHRGHLRPLHGETDGHASLPSDDIPLFAYDCDDVPHGRHFPPFEEIRPERTVRDPVTGLR